MKNQGRPKDKRIDDSVMAATKELLREVGYSGLSIEGIARKAEVGKPAIYRRWSHMGLLVFEALFSDFYTLLIPDFGSITEDLRNFLKLVSAKMNTIESREALAGLISDFQRNEELQRKLFESWLKPVSLIFNKIITRAVKRNEITELDNTDLLLDILAGTIYFRSLMVRIDLTDENIEQLLEIIQKGILIKEKK